MTIPQITLPGGFPAWLADNHSSTIDPVYASVPMRTGHSRLRRVYTTAPEQRRVALFLTEAQAPDFHAWFETDLQAGSLPFAAAVANRGPGLVWITARFVGEKPYEATPLHAAGGIAWRITATLLLTGDAQLSPPALDSLAARTAIGLMGRAVGTTTKNMTAATLVPLGGVVGDSGIAAASMVVLGGDAKWITPMAARNTIALSGLASVTSAKLLAASNTVALAGQATPES